MEKPRLGFHIFRKLPTKDQPHPCDQSCIVTSLNLDGTVNLVAYEGDGEQLLYEGASIAQATDDSPCHYRPACKEADKPAENKGGGGAPVRVDKCIVTYSPDDTNPSNLTCYQWIHLIYPAGQTPDDYVQGGAVLDFCDGPYYTSPGGANAAPTPPPPTFPPGPIPIQPTIPWWWLATPQRPSTPTINKSTLATSPQYYY